MLRTQFAFLALVPALALGWAACTGEADTSEEEAVAEEGAAMTAPRPGLFGTFRGIPTAPGGVAMLVLKSDGTYHRVRLIAPTTQYGPEDDGIYHVTTRGGASMMTLYSDGSEAIDRYRYVLSGDTLRLMAAGQRYWMTLERTPDAAWCGVPRDCALQSLPLGPCAGAWYCSASTCDYMCRPPL